MPVTTRKLVEGGGVLVFHVSLENTEGGELTDYVILKPSDLQPPLAGPSLRVLRIQSALPSFSAILKFDGKPKRHIWALPVGGVSAYDFADLGGIADDQTAPPADRNGQLLISTTGYSPKGSYGTFILKIRRA